MLPLLRAFFVFLFFRVTYSQRMPAELLFSNRTKPVIAAEMERKAGTTAGSSGKRGSQTSTRTSNNDSTQINNNIAEQQQQQKSQQDLLLAQTYLMPGKIVSDYYQWPVFFAILPPLLSLYYGGKVEEWSEGFMLLVIAFYLYGLVKIPWELYAASRIHYAQVNKVAAAYASGELNPEHEAERIRQQSLRKLWSLEWFYFVLVFASPLGGAAFLTWIRPYLLIHRNLIQDFPMALYVLTAYIRPFIHLTRLFKQHAAAHQDQVYYPNLDVDRLKRRLAQLETRCDQLSLQLATTQQESMKQVKETLEPNINGIGKEVRRSARKEQKFIDYSIERFRELEIRLQQQELFASKLRSYSQPSFIPNSASANTDHTGYYSSKATALTHIIFAPAYWVRDLVPRELSVGRIVMFPVNMGLKLVTWWVPTPVKRLVYPSSSSTNAAPNKPPHIHTNPDYSAGVVDYTTTTSSLNSAGSFQSMAPSPNAYPWDQLTRNIRVVPDHNNNNTCMKISTEALLESPTGTDNDSPMLPNNYSLAA